jgi:F0F1-type ATP synthase membrane subunit b/b'
LVSWVVLHFLFFKPLLSHLSRREEKTTLLVEQIREMKMKLQDLRQAYQEGKTQIYQECSEILGQAQKESANSRNLIVSKAKNDAFSHLNKERKRLSDEAASVSKNLILALSETQKALKELVG